jgi:PTS system nitrogen regulatory IIA component
MKIQDFLSPEHTRADISGVSKKRILEFLSSFFCAGDPDQTAADAIYQKLLERERLGSTGIGHGVAVPHCRVAGCEKITGALLKLSDAVDFDAVDGEPVNLVFALIVPDQQSQEHLEALAAIAGLLQDADYRAKLRGATSDLDLYQLAISQDPR